MPIPLVAAGIAGVGKFISGGGIKKIGNFLGGLFGKKKKKSASPVQAAASATVGKAALPVSSSRIVYGDNAFVPGGGTNTQNQSFMERVMDFVKHSPVLAVGIVVAFFFLFGKQIKKLF